MVFALINRSKSKQNYCDSQEKSHNIIFEVVILYTDFSADEPADTER